MLAPDLHKENQYFNKREKYFFNLNFKLKSELNIFFYYNSRIFCISRVNVTLRYQNNEILNLSNCFFSCRYGKPKPRKNFLKCKKQLIEGTNNAFPPLKKQMQATHCHTLSHTFPLLFCLSREMEEANKQWLDVFVCVLSGA